MKKVTVILLLACAFLCENAQASMYPFFRDKDVFNQERLSGAFAQIDILYLEELDKESSPLLNIPGSFARSYLVWLFNCNPNLQNNGVPLEWKDVKNLILTEGKAEPATWNYTLRITFWDPDLKMSGVFWRRYYLNEYALTVRGVRIWSYNCGNFVLDHSPSIPLPAEFFSPQTSRVTARKEDLKPSIPLWKGKAYRPKNKPSRSSGDDGQTPKLAQEIIDRYLDKDKKGSSEDSTKTTPSVNEADEEQENPFFAGLKRNWFLITVIIVALVFVGLFLRRTLRKRRGA